MSRLIALVFIFLPILLGFSMAMPLEYSNPKSQVEYISNVPGESKPNIVPITRPPLITQTAPPTLANSKNFAYNPNSQTWTRIKPGEPQPDDGTLIWNQSNDKWLTKDP